LESKQVEFTGNNITDAQSRWQTTPRIGASSSFAFGGNNTVLILGERDD